MVNAGACCAAAFCFVRILKYIAAVGKAKSKRHIAARYIIYLLQNLNFPQLRREMNPSPYYPEMNLGRQTARQTALLQRLIYSLYLSYAVGLTSAGFRDGDFVRMDRSFEILCHLPI